MVGKAEVNTGQANNSSTPKGRRPFSRKRGPSDSAAGVGWDGGGSDSAAGVGRDGGAGFPIPGRAAAGARDILGVQTENRRQSAVPRGPGPAVCLPGTVIRVRVTHSVLTVGLGSWGIDD